MSVGTFCHIPKLVKVSKIIHRHYLIPIIFYVDIFLIHLQP